MHEYIEIGPRQNHTAALPVSNTSASYDLSVAGTQVSAALANDVGLGLELWLTAEVDTWYFFSPTAGTVDRTATAAGATVADLLPAGASRPLHLPQDPVNGVCKFLNVQSAPSITGNLRVSVTQMLASHFNPRAI